MRTPWLDEAQKHLGMKEVAGLDDNPTIVNWLKLSGMQHPHDEDSWCAAFVNGVLHECGLEGTGKPNARSFMDWGVDAGELFPGAIVVFWRENINSWKGHVAICVSYNETHLMVIGGNQSSKTSGGEVTITRFPRSRIIAIRKPYHIEPKAAPLVDPVDQGSDDSGEDTAEDNGSTPTPIDTVGGGLSSGEGPTDDSDHRENG